MIDNRCKLLELRVFVFIFYRMITAPGLLAFLPASFFLVFLVLHKVGSFRFNNELAASK